MLEIFRESLWPGCVVLDVGAGDGTYVAVAIGIAAKIHAVAPDTSALLTRFGIRRDIALYGIDPTVVPLDALVRPPVDLVRIGAAEHDALSGMTQLLADSAGVTVLLHGRTDVSLSDMGLSVVANFPGGIIAKHPRH